MIEFTAEITDIREESRIADRQRWQMALDHTAFSPANSTGTLEAVAPSGARLYVPVLAVAVEGDEVWHIVEKPLASGTSVVGRVQETDSSSRLSATPSAATLKEFA